MHDDTNGSISTFSAGHDNWHNEDMVSTRAELIEKAKKGCARAKYELMHPPHNITALILNRQTII